MNDTPETECSFVDVAIPFLRFGNRQALTSLQAEQFPFVSEFIALFPHCFEHDITREIYIFYPCGDAPTMREADENPGRK